MRRDSGSTLVVRRTTSNNFIHGHAFFGDLLSGGPDGCGSDLLRRAACTSTSKCRNVDSCASSLSSIFCSTDPSAKGKQTIDKQFSSGSAVKDFNTEESCAVVLGNEAYGESKQKAGSDHDVGIYIMVLHGALSHCRRSCAKPNHK